MTTKPLNPILSRQARQCMFLMSMKIKLPKSTYAEFQPVTHGTWARCCNLQSKRNLENKNTNLLFKIRNAVGFKNNLPNAFDLFCLRRLFVMDFITAGMQLITIIYHLVVLGRLEMSEVSVGGRLEMSEIVRFEFVVPVAAVAVFAQVSARTDRWKSRLSDKRQRANLKCRLLNC